MKNHKEKEARDEQRLAAEARASTGGVCCGDEKWLPHVRTLSPSLWSVVREPVDFEKNIHHIFILFPLPFPVPLDTAGRGVFVRGGEPMPMSARSGPPVFICRRVA